MTNQQMEVLEYYTVLLNKEENRNLSLKVIVLPDGNVEISIIKKEESKKNFKEGEIDKTIDLLLTKMGVPAGLKGHKHIKEAIKIYLNSEKPQNLKLSEDVFGVIAKNNSTTCSIVERCIRQTIENLWICGNNKDHDVVLEYLRLNRRRKPTTKVFLLSFSNYIKMDFPNS